jgi:hypothetical protein
VEDWDAEFSTHEGTLLGRRSDRCYLLSSQSMINEIYTWRQVGCPWVNIPDDILHGALDGNDRMQLAWWLAAARRWAQAPGVAAQLVPPRPEQPKNRKRAANDSRAAVDAWQRFQGCTPTRESHPLMARPKNRQLL